MRLTRWIRQSPSGDLRDHRLFRQSRGRDRARVEDDPLQQRDPGDPLGAVSEPSVSASHVSAAGRLARLNRLCQEAAAVPGGRECDAEHRRPNGQRAQRRTLRGRRLRLAAILRAPQHGGARRSAVLSCRRQLGGGTRRRGYRHPGESNANHGQPQPVCPAFRRVTCLRRRPPPPGRRRQWPSAASSTLSSTRSSNTAAIRSAPARSSDWWSTGPRLIRGMVRPANAATPVPPRIGSP